MAIAEPIEEIKHTRYYSSIFAIQKEITDLTDLYHQESIKDKKYIYLNNIINLLHTLFDAINHSSHFSIVSSGKRFSIEEKSKQYHSRKSIKKETIQNELIDFIDFICKVANFILGNCSEFKQFLHIKNNPTERKKYVKALEESQQMLLTLAPYHSKINKFLQKNNLPMGTTKKTFHNELIDIQKFMEFFLTIDLEKISDITIKNKLSISRNYIISCNEFMKINLNLNGKMCKILESLEILIFNICQKLLFIPKTALSHNNLTRIIAITEIQKKFSHFLAQSGVTTISWPRVISQADNRETQVQYSTDIELKSIYDGKNKYLIDIRKTGNLAQWALLIEFLSIQEQIKACFLTKTGSEEIDVSLIEKSTLDHLLNVIHKFIDEAESNNYYCLKIIIYQLYLFLFNKKIKQSLKTEIDKHHASSSKARHHVFGYLNDDIEEQFEYIEQNLLQHADQFYINTRLEAIFTQGYKELADCFEEIVPVLTSIEIILDNYKKIGSWEGDRNIFIRMTDPQEQLLIIFHTNNEIFNCALDCAKQEHMIYNEHLAKHYQHILINIIHTQLAIASFLQHCKVTHIEGYSSILENKHHRGKFFGAGKVTSRLVKNKSSINNVISDLSNLLLFFERTIIEKQLQIFSGNRCNELLTAIEAEKSKKSYDELLEEKNISIKPTIPIKPPKKKKKQKKQKKKEIKDSKKLPSPKKSSSPESHALIHHTELTGSPPSLLESLLKKVAQLEITELASYQASESLINELNNCLETDLNASQQIHCLSALGDMYRKIGIFAMQKRITSEWVVDVIKLAINYYENAYRLIASNFTPADPEYHILKNGLNIVLSSQVQELSSIIKQRQQKLTKLLTGLKIIKKKKGAAWYQGKTPDQFSDKTIERTELDNFLGKAAELLVMSEKCLNKYNQPSVEEQSSTDSSLLVTSEDKPPRLVFSTTAAQDSSTTFVTTASEPSSYGYVQRNLLPPSLPSDNKSSNRKMVTPPSFSGELTPEEATTMKELVSSVYTCYRLPSGAQVSVPTGFFEQKNIKPKSSLLPS